MQALRIVCVRVCLKTPAVWLWKLHKLCMQHQCQQDCRPACCLGSCPVTLLSCMPCSFRQVRAADRAHLQLLCFCAVSRLHVRVFVCDVIQCALQNPFTGVCGCSAFDGANLRCLIGFTEVCVCVLCPYNLLCVSSCARCLRTELGAQSSL